MKTLIATAAVAAVSAVASAGPVTFEYVGTGRGENATISVGDTFSGRVFAGSITHRVNGETFRAYCIDPWQNAQTGSATFTHTSLAAAFGGRPNGAATASAVAELADIAGTSIWSSGVSKARAAGFQIALWEVITDFDPQSRGGSFDLAGGAFTVSAGRDATNEASRLLGALSFVRSAPEEYTAFVSGQHQDFMAVPTPGVLALGLTALPALGLKRRR